MVDDTTIQMWQLVPALVRRRFAAADKVAAALTGSVVDAWYAPQSRLLYVQGDAPAVATEEVIRVEKLASAPTDATELIRVKTADAFAPIRAPFELAGKLQGGPSPLSNAIVGGLLVGGMGYGAGTLLERMFPERYVERGKLRKTLGKLGLGVGTIPGLLQWGANYSSRWDAGEAAPFWRSLYTPNASTPNSPGVAAKLAMDSQFEAAMLKFAQVFGSVTGMETRPVPVDAFNRAIWNDVSLNSAANNPFGTRDRWSDASSKMYTPPHVAAAASGLVSGVQSQYGGASLLSPKHFVRGLASAGVDLATAHIAGSVLGALGGLTPAAQSKLQDMGLWGGLIRGVTSSVFGLR